MNSYFNRERNVYHKEYINLLRKRQTELNGDSLIPPSGANDTRNGTIVKKKGRQLLTEIPSERLARSRVYHNLGKTAFENRTTNGNTDATLVEYTSSVISVIEQYLRDHQKEPKASIHFMSEAAKFYDDDDNEKSIDVKMVATIDNVVKDQLIGCIHRHVREQRLLRFVI